MLLLLKVKAQILKHRIHSLQNEVTQVKANEEVIHDMADHRVLSSLHHDHQELHIENLSTSNASTSTPTDEAISFEDIGQYLFGWWGRFLVDLCLLSSQLGFCVVYQIFLGDSIHGLIPRLPKIACLLLPLPILITVCQIRRLKWLAATSFVALFVFCLGFVITLFFSIRRAEFGHVPLNMGPQSAGGFATLLSFAVFSFEGIGLVLPLENSIRPEIGPIFKRLFSATVGVVTLTYTFVGAIGYVAWGKGVGSSLLDNVVATQGRTAWVVLVIVGFLIGGFCSYPLNMYPVTVRLESLFKLADSNGNNISYVPYVTWKRAALRTGLVLLALLLAIAIPSFGLFIALIGSLFSTSLAFVFPTLFHMKLFSWPSHWPSGPLNLGHSRLRDLSNSPSTSSTSHTTTSSTWLVRLFNLASVLFDIVICLFGVLATIVCTVVSAQNIVAAVQSGTITWSFQSNPILTS